MDIVTAQKLAAQLQESERDRFGRVEVRINPTTGEVDGIYGRPYDRHLEPVKLA